MKGGKNMGMYYFHTTNDTYFSGNNTPISIDTPVELENTLWGTINVVNSASYLDGTESGVMLIFNETPDIWYSTGWNPTTVQIDGYYFVYGTLTAIQGTYLDGYLENFNTSSAFLEYIQSPTIT